MGVGNIVRQPAQAIVNPTDSTLSSRSGVSGAIHRAAGRELRKACEKAGPCREGDVRSTPAFAIEGVRYVIHMVVPQNSASRDDLRRLRGAYRQTLATCQRLGVQEVNFPPVPMGPGGLEATVAARLALETMTDWLAVHPRPHIINICCFTPQDLEPYEAAFEAMNREEEGSWAETASLPEVRL